MEFQSQTTDPHNRNKKVNFKPLVTPAVIVLLLAIIGLNSYSTVQYGHVGLYKTFGKLGDTILEPGVHFKIPFLQSVIPVNIQVAKVETDTSASSKDLQPVSTHIALNYSIHVAATFDLMNNIGPQFESVIIQPAIQEIVKEVTAKYAAEDLITKRDLVAGEVKDLLTKRLAKYNLNVNDINIVNFKFSDSFNQSIEAKQVAQQQALKAENDLKRVEIEAKQKVAQAQAEAESLKLKKLEITPDLVQLKQIEVQEKALEKWDGHLPSVTGGSMPFIDINALGKK